MKPWNVTVIASAEKLSNSISPRLPPSIVYAYRAPNAATSKCFVPRPISSSGVNPTRILPCGISGCAMRCAAAVTISATPALLSAPSSVVPDAVTMSWPVCSASAGSSVSRSTAAVSSGRTRSRPSYARCTSGRTLAPDISGDVSTWAMKPIVGTVAVRVDGRVDEPEFAQLDRQIAKQNELLVRARIRLRRFVGLGVVLNVLQKAIKNGCHQNKRTTKLTKNTKKTKPTCSAL